MRYGLSGRIALVASIVVIMLAGAAPARAALRIGGTLPTASLSALQGQAVRVPDGLRGKVVVLHFWSVGCSSCKEEMPAMENIYRDYRKRGLEILAVNVGQRPDEVKRFVGELRTTYPMLLDQNRSAAKLYEVTGVPRTYILDKTGVIRYKIIGGATEELLRKYIQSLL